jgi:hypothetical protein
MDVLKVLEEAVSEIDACVQIIASDLPLPEQVPVLDSFQFRHRRRTLDLLWCIKAVRIASANNAALVLIRSGYILESYALCRMIDETSEDIWFMSALRGEAGQPDKLQTRFMTEFFQEEFEDPDDPLSTTSRDRIQRKQIRAAISRLPGNPLDPSTHDAVGRSLYQAFSGFIHGAYVHVMHLFGGLPPHFHTRGMLRTPRMDECLKNQASYVSRSLMAIELVATLRGDAETRERAFEALMKLAKATGTLKPDAIARSESLRSGGT